MEMVLLNKTKCTVTEVTYILEHPDEGVFYYKEYLNERGQVVNSIMRTKHGYEIEDQDLVQEILNAIDKIDNNDKNN